MDAGRWIRFRDAQPLTEDSHHGRLPLTTGQRIAVIAIAGLAGWVLLGAAGVAVWYVVHVADTAARAVAHMRRP